MEMSEYERGLGEGNLAGSTLHYAYTKDCPHCHKEIPEDAKYCCYCGKRVD